jgi:16S rRNA (adenine1518-N6/adenine1519-N6)-dimethyltransferase
MTPRGAFDPGTLPPIREVIARHGLRTRKDLGQHFLHDGNLCARIVRAAAPLEDATVIEVGPGPGGLTRALLASPAAAVIAIERDGRCIEALRPLGDAAGGRLEVVAADALEVDVTALAPPPRAVVANLPYNVATPLLVGWLEAVAGDAAAFRSLTVMVQKEVADRLAAPPGSRTYGRLSVLAQWLCEVRRAFDVPARAFTPPPKVTSAVVRLDPRPRPSHPADAGALQRVCRFAFGQRRKMLRTSLKGLGVDAAALLAAAGVAGELRAEQLDIAQFCALARALDRVEHGPVG